MSVRSDDDERVVSRRQMSQSIPTSPITSRPNSHSFQRRLSMDDSQLHASVSTRVLRRVRALRPTRAMSRLFSDGPRNVSDSTVRQKLYDDTHLQDEDESTSANGMRVWYESYTSIDWIHDAVKESSRMRRLRALKGYRAVILNTWDRSQGWLIVSVTGFLTALIANWIIRSEAVLFDLKEGYCIRDWRLAKRFCCPYAGAPDWDGGPSLKLSATTQSSNISSAIAGTSKAVSSHMLAGWAGPVAASPKWKKIMEETSCPGWITWGDKFSLKGESNWRADYGMYVAIAVLWATIASLLTVYLTSSELYNNSKDGVEVPSASYAPNPSLSPHMPSERTPLLDSRQSKYDGHAADTTTNPRPIKYMSQIADQERSEKAIASRKVLYFGSGSGISEVKCILSGFVVHGYLGFWTLFTKSVGLTLAVASGLNLGSEGPCVHIASCVGNIVCRLFSKYEKNESKRREMLSCACAAGVAVAFGAPVGGVLFSLEEVSYYFPAKVMFRSFFCAMVAAATLRFLDPFGTGKTVLFQVTYDRDWHWIELIFFIAIGIFGGLYGALFTRLNVLWSTRVRAKSWMARHPVYEVVMITVISVIFSFLNGYTRMSGPELVADLFSECHEHESLDGLCVSKPSEIRPLLAAILFTMLAKGLLVIITFGIKLPAGIFIPSLAVGACFGRIVGLLVQYIQWTQPQSYVFGWCPVGETQSCIVPGVYAMVGAAATLAGVTRTTVSLVVIMFELTGTLTYAVPVMLSVLSARTVADALEHKGIYDLVLDFCGMPYLDAKEEHTWQGVTILDAVDTGVEVIAIDEVNTVESLRQKLHRLALILGYADGGFPLVVGSSSHPRRQRLVGYIAAQELEHGLNRITQTDTMADHRPVACTFQHVPTGLDENEEPTMRDSMMLEEPDSDLSLFVDKAPVTVSTSSPLELVHQMFVKLGVRYLIVINTDGSYKGLILKKRWLAFLSTLAH